MPGETLSAESLVHGTIFAIEATSQVSHFVDCPRLQP
jgi:hypothetical protein